MKPKYVFVLLASLSLLLSACGKEADYVSNPSEETNHQESQIQTAPETEQPARENEQEVPKLEEGIFIKWDDIKDPLFNEEIKNELQQALQALVDKDEESFKQAFIDEQSAQANLDRIGLNYRFDKVDDFEKDKGSGRISMIVQGEWLHKGLTGEVHNIYYFLQSKQGEWKLGTID
jgi:hypothetical protein